MKILFEAYWWFDGPPSGKNVLRSLVGAWGAQYPNDRITLLLPRNRRKSTALSELAGNYPNVEMVFTRAPQHALVALGAGAFSSRYDVVITQNFSPLLGRAKRCVFIHDLMFEEHPEWFTPLERAYLKGIVWASRRANIVLTSSRAESVRIASRLPQVSAPIVPIGLALSADYETSKSTAINNTLIPSDFLLSVGRINVRKNLEGLVRSLIQANLIGRLRPLVIIGKPDGAQGPSEQLDAATSDGSVLWTGTVSDGELKWAYENCSAFIFPSLDEGFGLPVLEAIDAGARIALSDIPAFREFGDIGVFFDPYDDADIADKVSELLLSPPRDRLPISREGSWKSTVTRLREVVS